MSDKDIIIKLQTEADRQNEASEAIRKELKQQKDKMTELLKTSQQFSTAGTKPNIPTFTGEDPSYSVEMFLEVVDRQAGIMKWNNAQKADAALSAMFKGDAFIWKANLARTEKEVLESAQLLWPLMKKRFSRIRSAGEKTKMVDALNQRTGEGVDTYLDRVINVCDQIADVSTYSVGRGAVSKDGFTESSSRWKRVLFVRGLRDHIRQQVESACEEAAPLAEVAKKARECEIAARGTPKINAVEVEGEVAALGKQLDRLRSEVNRFRPFTDRRGRGSVGRGARGNAEERPGRGDRGGGRGRGRGEFRGARGGGFSRGNDNRGQQTRRRFCTRCRQYGFHGPEGCPRSINEIAQLTPQNPNQGPPEDEEVGYAGFYRAVDGAVEAAENE